SWFKRGERKHRPAKRAPAMRPPPRVEALEKRDLLAAYLWTGANNMVDRNVSDNQNWLVGNAIPAVAPGPLDDLTFNAANAPGGQVQDAVVDAAFGGTVHSITVAATYNHTVTLNRTLLVTSTAEIDGGTIAGTGNFDVGD